MSVESKAWDKMMANINALNGVLKEEVKKLIEDNFDTENRDLEFSYIYPDDYSENMLLTALSDRGGVYFDWMIKDEVDEEEYEDIRSCDAEVEMLAELIDGVFYDRRG